MPGFPRRVPLPLPPGWSFFIYKDVARGRDLAYTENGRASEHLEFLQE
jgi:hypothetical protein